MIDTCIFMKRQNICCNRSKPCKRFFTGRIPRSFLSHPKIGSEDFKHQNLGSDFPSVNDFYGMTWAGCIIKATPPDQSFKQIVSKSMWFFRIMVPVTMEVAVMMATLHADRDARPSSGAMVPGLSSASS